MTTFIAWLALAVSVSSFVWQVMAWKRSGPRIRVELHEIRDAVSHHAFGVIVINDGRQAVTVLEVAVDVASYGTIDADWGADVRRYKPDRLPTTIDPGSEIRVYASISSVKNELLYAAEYGPDDYSVSPAKMVPRVRVGSSWIRGSFVKPRRRLRYPRNWDVS